MVKKGKAEGEELSYSVYGNTYNAPIITPERAVKFLKNVHMATQLENLQVQIFPGEPRIWVEDENGEEDEKLSSWMRKTAEKVRMYPSMQISWYETMGFGASVKSPGYTRRGGKLEMAELRNLPAYRFGQYPGHGDIQNELMPGIIVNDVGEVEVWQSTSDGMKQIQINNFSIISDPTSPKPAGEAYVLPVYPLIAAINFANKASDQQINRIGAPSIFAQLENMSPDVKAWADNFVKKWGKSTSFTIPAGVTFPDVKIRETRTAEDRLKLLVSWIESYFNPTTVLQKGNSMGASDKGASQIWANYIAGTQAWIESSFEAFFKPLLEANGYDDRYVRIELKRPELDRSSEIREQVKIGFEAKAITTKEIRDNLSELELMDTDDKILAELKEQYKSTAPAMPFGNVVPEEQLDAEERTIARLNKINEAAERRILEIMEGM